MGALRILVLGGSRFVGRHIADAFIARGDSVTLFNRGITDPAPRDHVQQLRGDRSADLSALDGQTWDAVIDPSGYTPDVVARSARFLEPRTSRYLFISSASVYDLARLNAELVDEDAPLSELPAGADPTLLTDEHYGALKVLCETEVTRAFGERTTILRLGLVAGPYDPTDRFTYWVVRVAATGEILAPPADRVIQYIDARDVAEFAAATTRDDIGGTFNLVVPPEAYTFGDLIEACASASASHPRTRWTEEEFLLERGVQPWSELPLWIPRGDEAAPLLRVAPERARSRGLRTRSLTDTARDTYVWAAANRNSDSLKAGLSRAKEKELLDAADG